MSLSNVTLAGPVIGNAGTFSSKRHLGVKSTVSLQNIENHIEAA